MKPQDYAALGTMFREAIEKHVKTAVEVLSESFGKALQERDEKIAALEARKEYDDTDLRERIGTAAKSIPSPYDEAGLLDRLAKQLEALREQIPAAYDDSALRQQIETVAKMASERPTPADGRDALQLEVLPAIDEKKSYTRGTYAKHAGGLWRAFEQTSGLRGWECIVEGVKELQVDMVDKRLSVKAVMSSGSLTEMVKELPIQIYRGVFKSDDPYHQGDTVTWAGSLWHCNVTGTKALPGDGSADWTLAVKKGRDGREVVKTERVQGSVKL